MSNDNKHFSAGDRVRVLKSYHWARDVLGTIREPQEELKPWLEGWIGCSKEEPSLKGLLTFYWVEFDEPQIDADGAGPYLAGAIDCKSLIRCH